MNSTTLLADRCRLGVGMLAAYLVGRYVPIEQIGGLPIPGMLPGAAGLPVRLKTEAALDPVWSPDGSLIAYTDPVVGLFATLRAMRPDGTAVELPEINLRLRGERYRFLPNGKSLVYMQGEFPWQNFWLLDLTTRNSRPLSNLTGSGTTMRTFDITPDGKQIVFDRLRENTDVVLIDLMP